MSDQQSLTPSSSSKLHQHSSHRILSSWASLRRRLSSSTSKIDTDGTSFAKTSRHTKQGRARRRSSSSTLSISTRSSYGSIDDQDDSHQIQSIPTEVQMTNTYHPSYVPYQQQRQEDVPSDGHVCDLQYTYIHDSITYQGIYTGQVKCSKPHGIGTWRYESGNGSVILSIEGEWFCGFSISGQKKHEHIPHQKHSPLTSILRRSTKHTQEKDVYNKSVQFKREATLVTFGSLPCLHEGDKEDSSSASSIGDDDESIASIDSIEGVYEEFVLRTTTPPAA